MAAILEKPKPKARAATAPQTWKWTREQYHELAERGYFEGKRVELIDGEIMAMAPMNDPHAIAIVLALEALRKAFVGEFTFRPQMPMNLGTHYEPEPDILIQSGNPRDNPKHPTTALLILEVAESSLLYDCTIKAKIYAKAGIADYWVLDLDGNKLYVFREPSKAGYKKKTIHKRTDSVAPLALPQTPIKVSEMLL